MPEFHAKILNWFDAHGRHDLPWQFDPTPYRVWISEIMLQQTQVATVIPYYQRFLASYPNVAALAATPIDDVLHHWSGLGYYARARNLHKAAQVIVERCDGEFPSDFDEVVALPGIGRSTAGAILALSGGQRHAILDGNVKRVLARHFAIDGWPGKAAVARQLWDLAENLTPWVDVAQYTQAIMDLGATVCTRSNPACRQCPIQSTCAAHSSGAETAYPGRKPRHDKPQREVHMVIARHDGALYLEKRPPRGIWGGLYSFPELSSVDEVGEWCERRLNVNARSVDRLESRRHSFTHYDLDIHPLTVDLEQPPTKDCDKAGLWFPVGELPKVGIAAPVKEIIREFGAKV